MTITYRDSAPASALSEFEERCEAFKVRLQSEDFLHNRGLGNEVGIYTFCYDSRLKAEARRFLDRLKGDPSLPCRIREANLYDILLDICADKRILDAVNADPSPVLCFVDEVLRGTNTVERIAASTQVLKSLHRPGVICFAATHDIELTRLLEKEYDNYHFEEQVEEDDIQFNYRLMPGRAGSRNAIRLLGVIGYDQEIIREADRMAQEFLQTGEWSTGRSSKPAGDAG